MNAAFPRAAAFLGAAFFAYVVYGIYDAGRHDVPAPPKTTDIVFLHGSMNGQRITTRSWSADYDRIVSNADQTVLELERVRHGIIFKNGKPYLRVRAEHMSVNTISRDFTATGGMHVESIGTKPRRWFDTSSAAWTDSIQRMTMAHRVLIHNGTKEPLSVGSLTFDVKTGQIDLHAVDGPVRFK